MEVNSAKAVGYLYLPYLALSSAVALFCSLLNYFVLFRLNLPLVGLIGALFFFALFDVGDEDNRGWFILSAIGGAVASFLFCDYLLVHRAADFSTAANITAFATGMLIAVYYIPNVRHSKKTIEP